MLVGACKLMTGRNQLLFITSAGRGLPASSDHIHFGLPLALGFALLPSTHNARPALPARYTVANKEDYSRRQGRAAAVLEQEAIGFSPVFTLSRHCSRGLLFSSNRSRSSVTSRSCATATPALSTATVAKQQEDAAPESSKSSSSSSSSSPDAAKQQLKLQYALQQQQQQQQPWLGADLDVAGFTKKGYMRGGGKEQNQDRGLIMQRFRSPGEMLLGVMDGHGTYGHLVSTYLIQHLPAVLMQHLVSAAAAVTQGSRSTWQQQQQGLKKQKGSRHDKQQQQQPPPKPIQQLQPEMFGSHQLQFVVMPDHQGDPNLGQHGSSSSSSTSYSSNLSGPWAALAEASKQQGAKTTRHGRAVSKNKITPQPDHSSSSSSSSVPGTVAVPEHLVAQVPLTASLLSAVFAETDHMLIGSGINTLDSGSTAVLCHIGHDSLTTAWVGDSRAVVGRKVVETGGMSLRVRQQHESSSSSSKWQAIQLSDDHKPERPDEQLRIILNEGRVQQMSNGRGQGIGPYRVWFKEIDYPGLAMSRAFGDTPCRRIGVTVEPELYVHRLKDADQLLVAATDGVWEYLSNEEVVQLAASCSSAEVAARKVVEAAEQRWRAVDGGGYVDDITAVVVRATPRLSTSKL